MKQNMGRIFIKTIYEIIKRRRKALLLPLLIVIFPSVPQSLESFVLFAVQSIYVFIPSPTPPILLIFPRLSDSTNWKKKMMGISGVSNCAQIFINYFASVIFLLAIKNNNDIRFFFITVNQKYERKKGEKEILLPYFYGFSVIGGKE
jgi:hypothetical protein